MDLILIFAAFGFGLIIGSFLNCLIWRLRKSETILGRSYCPQCKHQLAWYDNIPLFSFIFLKGRCRYCHKPISWQYPLVELVAGLLFALSFYYDILSQGGSVLGGQFLISDFLTLIRDWFLVSIMIIIFIYDLRWYLILDVVSLPACLIVLIFNLAIGFYENNEILQNIPWQGLLFSGIIGSSFFLLQFIISRGKWIGGGDIRLGLLMGLALGWPSIVVALFLAYVLGSVVGLGLIAMGKKQWGSKVPFGVFLSTATLVTLFWGKQLLAWYLGLF